MASLRLLARASSSRASSLSCLPSSSCSRSIPTLRSNSTTLPPPPPPSPAATEPSLPPSSSSSSSVPSLASSSSAPSTLESTGLVVTRTGKTYPALPPRQSSAPRAPDSPIPMSDEERLARDKVDKVLISDEQLIWIVGISMFGGAGWWAMQMKDKKKKQAVLINEMRTRTLYDSGTLNDDE